ncbi:GHKL domain-containing protein [Lacrimispora xylanisolvens]|uniref:GHKL domain-containing protein n=1 Tax=Lacrimispora xylanisolvens TaxID=384636 RepID=UPI003D9C8B74
MIEITNPVPHTANPCISPFLSSKEDPHLHGIGLSNIRDAVERCNGTMDISISEELFHFCVMIQLFPPSH